LEFALIIRLRTVFVREKGAFAEDEKGCRCEEEK
jgi:hypothetical protein